MSSVEINPYEECRLYTSNSERERWESMATLFGIIVSLDALERAYVRESVSESQYAPACTRLLAQYKTISKLVITGDGGDGGANVMPGIPTIRDVQHFMTNFKVSRLGCSRSMAPDSPVLLSPRWTTLRLPIGYEWVCRQQ